MALSFSLYDIIMKPLENKILRKARRNLVSHAHGVVLEVGAGTGANLDHYHFKRIDQLDILDIDLQQQVLGYEYPDHLPVRFIEGQAESLPLTDNVYDYVIITLVLCSVTNLNASLAEVYRVLKPGGSFVFIEHVLPKNQILSNLFHMFTPLWRKVGT
jgi:ubiquinone/menaquinone biosynthesis C-methylase UbiE